MVMTPQAIIAELEAAFPAKRPPDLVRVIDETGHEEPLLLQAAFADKEDWTKLDPEWLDRQPRGFGSALSFFSDRAICFYIPAYIKADVLEKLDLSDPAYTLSMGFDDRLYGKKLDRSTGLTWTENAKNKWINLNKEQCKVIVEYLLWRKRKDEFDRKHIIPALSRYWLGRIS